MREREDGETFFEIRRLERDEIRDLECELLVITGLGTDAEQIQRFPLTLTREVVRRRFRLEGDSIEEVEVPANERGV